jgi:uncharacterized protein YkwD
MLGCHPRRNVRRLVVLAVSLAMVAGPLGSSPAGASTPRARTLRLINDTRVQHDRRRLELQTDLSQVARKHTRAMIRRNELFHTRGLATILSKYGYRVWGENVGCARSVWALHRKFMHSEPHRKNILKKAFRWVGLGVLQNDGSNICGAHSIWATEIFYG